MLYLYGIIEVDKRESFGPNGIETQREVYTIPYHGIGGVVNEVSSTYKPTIEDAPTHEKIIRQVMGSHTIIPMGFGTILPDERCVERILRKGYPIFKKMFARIADKIQVDVKVLWDKNKICGDILTKERKIRDLARKPKKSRGTRIKLGELVYSALREERENYVEEIKDALSNFSPYKENKLTDDCMITNLSYLVNKAKEQEFYKVVNKKDNDYGEKLQFIAVGPLPPYNFTRVKFKRANFKLIENARRTLGLPKEITEEELKEKYRRLAYKYHPDRNPGDRDAEKMFKKVEQEYALLADYCKHYRAPKISLTKDAVERTIMVIEE